MTKEQLIEHVVNNSQLSRSQAIEATAALIDALQCAIKNGEDVKLKGFGTIKSVTTAQRTARNIRTGERVLVPARRSAKLVLSKNYLESINR